jgi:hypothetical protein
MRCDKMIVKKRAYYVIAVLLIFTTLCPMVHTVAAQTIEATDGIGSWKPPKNFVNPVALKIQEFRSQGLSDEQITPKLAELGMGWYPQTGATWLGRSLTAEELAKMPPITPVASPENALSQEPNMLLDMSARVSSMRTKSYSFTGVSAEIVANSMSSSSGQTQYHYVCMQLGDLDGTTNWAETVVTHNAGEPYKWFTFDSDEGDWSFYMNKNTPSYATDTYVIMLDGTYSGGWKYDVWINYQWVRSAHLSSLWVQAGLQKEVYSTTGQFTNDASHSVFYRNWLHNAGGWSSWTNSVGTKWSAMYPIREAHSMGVSSYYWETWVQN